MGTASGTAKGKGSGFDPAVITMDDAPALEARLAELRAEYELGAEDRREEAAVAAVDKAEEALAAAKDALENVRRERPIREAEAEAGRIAKAEKRAAAEAATQAAEDEAVAAHHALTEAPVATDGEE